MSDHSPRSRSWTHWVMVGAVALLAAVSTLAVWAGRTALDSERFSDKVEASLEDDRMTVALATYLTTQITSVIDLDQLARDVIPGDRDALAAPLARATEEFVLTRVTNLVGSEQFIEWLSGAVERAHRAAIDIVEGDTGPAVSTDDGGVVINLVPVIAAVLERLGADGLVDRVSDLPTLDENAQLGEVANRVAAALGRELPDDFGQIRVVQAGTLDDIEPLVQMSRTFVWLLVAASVISIGALIIWARDRRSMLIHLGLAIIAADVLVYAIFARLARRATTDRPAASAITDVLRDSLLHVMIISVLIAIAVVLAARFTTPAVRPGDVPASNDPAVSPAAG